MDRIDTEAFEYAVASISDGHLFEEFAQNLLCQILGVEFTPLGRTKDRGIDGLEHCFTPNGISRTVHQISIHGDPVKKIRQTLTALRANAIECQRFFYVTNRFVPAQDILIESLYKDFQVSVTIRDLAWLRGNVNMTEGTIRTFYAFIDTHLHTFAKAGAAQTISDLEGDPRVFVFLRQQWEEYGSKLRLDQLLLDSLIIYALEGTDPDKNILMSPADILNRICTIIRFAPKQIELMLPARLAALSSKPRRINHHTLEDKYCVPFTTRCDLEQKNLHDKAIYEGFLSSASHRLTKHLNEASVQVKDTVTLLCTIFNTLFKDQGLEFADFVLKAESHTAIDRSLPEIVSARVDDSCVIPDNRPVVKDALLRTIREIIYLGTPVETAYLRSLSQTYMMLFLLQCDPKVATYFASMASKLDVFVCTSILIPAISELPLPREHRRHWNLLINAQRVGVRLIITDAILEELLAHINKTIHIYQDEYAGREDIFTDEYCVLYIPEILIRSYFYARLAGSDITYNSFVEKFVTPKSTDMRGELIEWLHHSFGIQYREHASLGVTIDRHDHAILSSELSKHKRSFRQAEKDARTILTVFAMREKNNEKGTAGIFGYRTWWLSRDTTTLKAVTACFRHRYPLTCYLRPDFLYNFIALTPTLSDTQRVFDDMFPSLMGISLSRHLPEEIITLVHQAIKAHADLDPGRVKALLRNLADRLKTDLDAKNIHEVRLFLDDQLKRLPRSTKPLRQ
jgi:hypothetical protein